MLRSLRSRGATAVSARVAQVTPLRSAARTARKTGQQARSQSTSSSTASSSSWGKDMLVLGAIGGAYLGSLALADKAEAMEDSLPIPHYEWNHTKAFSAFDTAAVRRGFEVYRQVCSTCHSLEYISYRNLVGVSHTKEQAEALAKSIEVQDGPDDKGEMFKRPGALTDRLPNPYPNTAFARYANGGALPPDLSLMVKARPGGVDYVFQLLTGYREAPAGIKVRQGLYYNPYFAGGLIAMPPPLQDGQVEYEDGTPATISQMAKDVSVFLAWTAEPEADERKKLGFKSLVPFAAMVMFAGYYKRMKWQLLKNRKISWLKNITPPSHVKH